MDSTKSTTTSTTQPAPSLPTKNETAIKTPTKIVPVSK